MEGLFQGWGACPSSTVFQAWRKLNMSEDIQGLSIHRASEDSCPESHHSQHRGREQGRERTRSFFKSLENHPRR